MNAPVARLLIALAIAVAGAGSAFARSGAEDAARLFVARAYAGDFAHLAKSARAATDDFERVVRYTLRVRCVAVDGIVIRDAAESGDKATVLLTAVVRKSDRETPAAWRHPETIALRLELARERDGWLVTALGFPEQELADRLLAADDEERRRLLRAHAAEITPGVARAVYARAIALTNVARANVAGAAALAHEMAQLSGDLRTEALALCIDAFIAWNKEDSATAMRVTLQSLDLAQALDDPDALARAWYTRGRALDGALYWESRFGRSNERSEAYRKALAFAERAEDPSILTRVLYSMANIAVNQEGDNVTARRLVDRILPIAIETGDAALQMSSETVLTTIYLNQHDGERALFHHLRALKLAEQHQLRAYTSLLLRSGELYLSQNRFDEARAALAKALPRNERGEIVASPLAPANFTGNALFAAASLEAKSGNLEEARCIAAEAAKFSNSPGPFDFVLAEYYLKRRDYRAALRASLPAIDVTPYRDERVLALGNAARAYHGLGQIDRGYALMLEAMQLVEGLDRSVAGDEQQKARSADSVAATYRIAAALALARREPAEALAVVERGRARVLTQILESGRPGTMAEAEAAERERQSRYEQNLTRLTLALERARGGEATRLSEQLRDAREEYASFLDGIHARSERLRATRSPVTGARLREALRTLPPGLVCVEYIVDDQNVYAVVARGGAAEGGRIVARTTRIDRPELLSRVNRFVQRLAARDLRASESARQLYALLIAPVEKDLAGAEALLIVPDGMLWRVPFAALADRRGRFLVERWPLVYAPSITAYAAITHQTARRPHAGHLSFLGIADPKLDASARAALTDFYRGATLGALPGATREVDALRLRYGARSGVVLKREQATEGRTKALLGRASVVHFATHALIDNANPMYSRLVLARDENGSENGWLESWEIARLDLDADLVVLAACDTARGDIRGEGVVGLGFSFFVAGARSLVAAQWKVASNSTADLMIRFHRGLGAAAHDPLLSKAQALREAQLELLHREGTAHPFYWAPFVLLGDASWSAGTR